MEGTTLTLQDAAKKILEEKSVTIEDKEIFDQMVEDVEKSISERIHSMMIRTLNDSQKSDLDGLIERNAQPEEVQEFFAANITNVPDIIATAILDVRNIYLAN